jgi:aryl-alcohol dehydrogenase-like predicted oxidoreductase
MRSLEKEKIRDMKEINLGRSKIIVTPIGLGLAALGRPGYINLGHNEDIGEAYFQNQMERHAHQVLDAAWEAGVRYFDAARSYGRAEKFISTWIAKRQEGLEEIIVGSKWGYIYTADWQVKAEKHEIKEHSLPVLQQQIGESHSLLGNHLKLYQIHSATFESGILKNQPVLAELARLRDTGLLIGLSLSGPSQAEILRTAMEIQFGGQPLFGSVQATWNLLETSVEPALQEASDAGMGVIVKEALANGRLTSRNKEPTFKKKKLLLRQIADEHGASIDAVALAAAISKPWSSVILSGASTVDQLSSNIRALDINYTPEVDELLLSLSEPPEVYWETRSHLPWN